MAATAPTVYFRPSIIPRTEGVGPPSETIGAIAERKRDAASALILGFLDALSRASQRSIPYRE